METILQLRDTALPAEQHLNRQKISITLQKRMIQRMEKTKSVSIFKYIKNVLTITPMLYFLTTQTYELCSKESLYSLSDDIAAYFIIMPIIVYVALTVLMEVYIRWKFISQVKHRIWGKSHG